VIRRSAAVKPGAGDLVAVHGERGLDGVDGVVGQDDRVCGGGAGHAGGVGQGERRHARTGRGEQGVDVAVVVTGELDHLRPAGEAARQPQGTHRRLGARIDQPHLLDRGHPGHDLLGEQHLALGRRAEGEAVRRRGRDRRQNLGVGMAEDQRPPGADQVDVAPLIGVDQVRPLPPDEEPRRAADRAERPDR
jgi:hypothetical protein